MRSSSLLLLAALLAGTAATAADHPGRKAYLDKCASCHGKNGEGVRDKYGDPLVGDRSLAALIRYIEKQMPEEKPETCVGEEAKQVSAYIYEAFYSPEAQLRANPPRVELTRLTVNQYRTTIADLIASFTNQTALAEVCDNALRQFWIFEILKRRLSFRRRHRHLVLILFVAVFAHCQACRFQLLNQPQQVRAHLLLADAAQLRRALRKQRPRSGLIKINRVQMKASHCRLPIAICRLVRHR
jgi:antitoxin component HigA of HigAB toxin-antitoxin module